MTSTDTKRLLKILNACTEARAWVGRHTLQWAWEHCERGDWMEWLADRLGVTMTPEAWAEYERVRAPALAEYRRVTAQALAEYERVRAPAYRAAIPWEQIERAAKEGTK